MATPLNLSVPIRQVVLGRMGGLYTEAESRDLPIGASPLNFNSDFIIGSTTIRPGLVSIQSFGAPVPPVVPQLLKLVPEAGPVGTSVAIRGAGFGASQQGNAPLMTGLAPARGPTGTSVLISGANFGASQLAPGTGTISPTATIDYIRGSLFTWVNSVGPVNIFQADDGSFWVDYETSGNATLIYGDGVRNGFINQARMLSDTFAQYEYCCLGNWGNIPARIPLQGVDQPRTFTVQLGGGAAAVQFDRISQVAPASNSFVVTSGGGAGTTFGGLAAGARWAVMMYQMRNGYITPASMPVPFTTAAGNGALTFAGLPTGPPEAQYIIVAVTIPVAAPSGSALPPLAGIGGPYFYVPLTNPTYSTVKPNGTAGFTVPMADVILTSGINISVEGNNLLSGHQRELGESVKVVNYGARAFYLGERTKIDNFVNLTFDGGISPAGDIPGWAASVGVFSLIPSPIYGLTLDAAGDGILFQTASNDVFGVPILQAYVQYNARITAWADATAAGSAVVSIVATPTAPASFVPPSTPPLTTTPTEYILTAITPPGGLVLNPDSRTDAILFVSITGSGGGHVFIDRIEIYPAVQPVYQAQLAGSYIENYQAVDAQTGTLDTLEFTYENQTNAFRFLQSLYITTESHTFTTSTDPTSEPAGWAIQEVSNAVGCAGPAAADVGEEYVLLASRRGVFLFDGGNHVKLSQEIQSLWEKIWWPSASQIWILNDLRNYRLFVGVPMTTPNFWLPNAPEMEQPAIPNVILMCNYLGDATGSEIAGSPGVHVSSFTGQLLARDFTRKWSPWLIPAAYGAGILKGAQSTVAGYEQIWLGGEGNATVWNLDRAARTDQGAPIDQAYYTYGFADEPTAEAKQLTTTRRIYSYMSVTTEGVGGLVLTTLPGSLDTPYADVQPAVQMRPVQTDRNIPIDETGDRLFLKFASDGEPGSYFTLHRVVLGIQPDPWIAVSGSDDGEITVGRYGGAQ